MNHPRRLKESFYTTCEGFFFCNKAKNMVDLKDDLNFIP